MRLYVPLFSAVALLGGCAIVKTASNFNAHVREIENKKAEISRYVASDWKRTDAKATQLAMAKKPLLEAWGVAWIWLLLYSMTKQGHQRSSRSELGIPRYWK
ncbi:TPA: hypothetical protein SMW48_002356 [Pseudomonas aeruginosa]|uniref:hypothetical protein n=1 Tax=Pseudomonas paraeruginosa TaxID=2994495 RepID=UPI0029E5FDEB|nr:hypothetical protein [Pseudomonas aeruginosa]MDF5927337.1 hypothetical protein [Pseudomonas aeruginosa]HBN8235850.1 hypothetical protein [Pseudomonas aeruginosa]HCF0735538.1 hypothetical protein [Pseudomonas aeruginosa]HEK0817871.1 hypothetical protein [Pseudomonas aeruginosa]